MRLIAYIGIGSNLNDPVAQVQEAFEALDAIPDSVLVARSSLYSSKPMGPTDQPDYVNAVAAIDTLLSPQELLKTLREIEDQQGRERAGDKWGPRILDLDLLLYGKKKINTAELVVPHPGLHERDFVIIPLGEIAGNLNIPGHGPLAVLIKHCENHSLKKLITGK
ncbi:MAG: 2-amino-4-hydroxy-6-hydroxymethyldihydropteridine diphosphokinase [Gammaproteobacteria bacterium]|nr:2-amino-4-hydroxy-6-hydroxymethyldihydropteridine diphosphokinase [Gammaproteobacteria bacterium]